jgi:16S rRNA (adenine1518-N6/adenine1519-N6)-dimethyltransferase
VSKSSRKPTYKKRLGQHHLVSGDLCRPLLEFLRPEGLPVVEIGPGAGVLTQELVHADARVLAVELDVEWAFVVRSQVLAARVLVADALRFPWDRLPAPTLVAGNLPFQVASPLLADVLTSAARDPQRLPRIGVMVQKEVAERLVAGPGDPAYGALSVLVRATSSARILGHVAPGSFRPPPKVSASFVGLETHPPPVDALRLPELLRVVHQAFSQRRKTLRNSLGSGWGKPEATAALEAAGIDPGRRAETLGVDDFVRLLAARTS